MTYCRHCCHRKVTRPRRLCHACYYTPAILALYPVHPVFAARREKSDAELDAMIEERRRTAPEWFHKEARTLASSEETARNRESAGRFRTKIQLPRKWRGRA